jgi:hypothetical protein
MYLLAFAGSLRRDTVKHLNFLPVLVVRAIPEV